jgi:hypothetical protein
MVHKRKLTGKFMLNPIFNLIQSHKQKFNPHFTIELKTAKKTNSNYYLIAYTVHSLTNLSLGGVTYCVQDFHISIYSDIRKNEAYGQASYHLTVNISDSETKELSVMRAYFNKSHQLLYINLTDAENHIKTITYPSAITFAHTYVANIAQEIDKIYSEASTLADTHYTDLVNKLEKMSEGIHSLDNLKHYLNIITDLISHLEHWNSFAFNNPNTPVKYFVHVKNAIEKKIATSTTKTINSNQILPIQKIDDSVKSNDVELENKDYTLTSSTINTEYLELKQAITQLIHKKASSVKHTINEHILLTKLIDISPYEEEILICLLKLKKIRENAYKELMTIILMGNLKNIEESDIEELVKIIPAFKFRDLFLTVKNNRKNILKHIIRYHNYLNLNLVDINSGCGLLQEAYNNKNLEMFYLLLQYPLNPDLRDADLTILMQACRDNRQAEALALLAAKADPFAMNLKGFNALGIFMFYRSLGIDGTDLKFIEKYLTFCDHDIIDLLQGPTGQEGSVMQFACQKEWIPLVKYFLSLGANPSLARTSDFLSCLAIAVSKSNMQLCQLILNESKYILSSEACSLALIISLKMLRTNFSTAINSYMEKNHLQQVDPSNVTLHKSASPQALKALDYFKQHKNLPDNFHDKVVLEHNSQTYDLGDINVHHILTLQEQIRKELAQKTQKTSSVVNSGLFGTIKNKKDKSNKNNKTKAHEMKSLF